jgi:hypothetical protein
MTNVLLAIFLMAALGLGYWGYRLNLNYQTVLRERERALAELSTLRHAVYRAVDQSPRDRLGDKEVITVRGPWFNVYRSSLPPNMRYMDTEVAEAGYDNMVYKNTAVVCGGLRREDRTVD